MPNIWDHSFKCKFTFPAPYVPFHHSMNSYGGHRSYATTLDTINERCETVMSLKQPNGTISDWCETDDSYVLKFDLSRFKKENIKVKLEHEAVKISNSDGFSTTVPFPRNAMAGYATSKVENGELTVEAPKKT